MQWPACFTCFSSSAGILRVQMEEWEIWNPRKEREYGESFNSLLLLLLLLLLLIKQTQNELYEKRDGKTTDIRIKYVWAKDFFKLKFLGKWHFLNFIGRATTACRVAVFNIDVEHRFTNYNDKMFYF